MELFDYFGELFVRSNTWKAVSKIDKSRHHFMMHRFLSINYAVQANELNRIGMNPVSVADYWHSVLMIKHNQVPKWMYTSTGKKKKEVEPKVKVSKKDKPFEPKEETIFYWMKSNGYNERDHKQMNEFFPEELKAELKELERLMEFM